MALESRERLIVALDVPSAAKAETMVTQLGDSVRFFKIGYQLAGFRRGVAVRQGIDRGWRQAGFLDLKLHDIGNNRRQGASRSVAQLGATFLTLQHAYPQTMRRDRGQARIEIAYPGGDCAHVI